MRILLTDCGAILICLGCFTFDSNKGGLGLELDCKIFGVDLEVDFETLQRNFDTIELDLELENSDSVDFG